jgi:hypothetical protein
MHTSNVKNTPLISGIDALYYFAQSGAFYDRFFDALQEQIEDKKEYFSQLNYTYTDNDIIIKINGIDVIYSGMGRDGFHWFNHEFFRSGFKDSEKAPNIHNIRIQLNAVGIYTLGIKSLLEYINTVFLKEITNKHFPVTRIDLNMFVQHDFKYLRKEMILSKKKNHAANIGERSSGYELETYYVGKKPFLLRIYNKHKELQTASSLKRELMHNYFGINGLDLEKPIFNVEFELHREFLKQYSIDTIEDVLERAEILFKQGCDLIRLIDTQSITEKQLNSPNRKRAKTLPIWEQIKNSYEIKEFLQLNTALDKIESITQRYSLEDARKSIKKIITRLLIHDNHPTSLYFMELLQSAKEDYDRRQQFKTLHDTYQVEQEKELTSYDHFVNELKTYSDEGLVTLEEQLSIEMQGLDLDSPEADILSNQMIALYDEYERRHIKTMPF